MNTTNYGIIFLGEAMKKILAILIGKLVCKIGSMVGRGSIAPGEVASKIEPKLLEKMKLPQTIIAVTGSSGKGSVTSMITEVLKKEGHTVIYNNKGSNLPNAILTSVLETCTITGKTKEEYMVCEIDERYTKYLFPAIDPNYVVITNLTRDQPPRQGHFDLVYEEIQKGITNDMHLILNADDPYLYKFTFDHKGPISYYGIHKNGYSYKKSIFENLNFIYCPKCHSKLNYLYYHFENIGDFKCPNCDFKRVTPNYEITKLDYLDSICEINKKYHLHFPFGILYCAYNTLAAFSLLSELGLPKETITEDISKLSHNKKIYDKYPYQGHEVYVLNNKNENSSTFNQSLLFVKEQKCEKSIVIGWKEISRRYHFDDLSWLYDIDFELLKNDSVHKIYCVGPNRYDIATRLKYAGIDEKKLVIYMTLEEMVPHLQKSAKENIYAILNFDYVEPFNKLMNMGDQK